MQFVFEKFLQPWQQGYASETLDVIKKMIVSEEFEKVMQREAIGLTEIEECKLAEIIAELKSQ